MKHLRSVSLLLAVLVSSCSAAIPDVDFCQVLIAAPKYEGRTFKTEIIVVPSYHGSFATISRCKARVVGFAEGSFSGSPTLQNLRDQVERADRMGEGPSPKRAVAVRVTARIEKAWFPVPGAASPKLGYRLKLLDADVGRLVDIPEEILQPPESGMAQGPEPSREEKPR